MRRNTRRALFYVSIAIFIVATPLVVLYAVGYGIDLTARNLISSGGFFVKTNVSGIRVLVDNEPRSETNFISRGSLTTGLPPGLYAIRVEKDGYWPWRKSIEIEEQVIQEFRSIILVPKDIEANVLFKTASTTAFEKLIPSPDDSRILLVQNKGSQTTLSIIEKDGASFSVALPPNRTLASYTWNSEGNAILIGQKANRLSWSTVTIEDKKPVPLFDRPTIEVIPVGTTTNAVKTIPVPSIHAVTWDRDQDSFYILHRDNLYRWDKFTNTAKLILENVHSFAVVEDRILFVTKSGFLAESNRDGEDVIILDRPGFYFDETPFTFLKSREGLRAVIDSAGGLYVEHREAKRFVPIQGNRTIARIAPEREVLAFSGGSTIKSMMLADETRQPFRKRYAESLVIDAVVPIKEFFWLGEDSTHFVFSTDQGVFLTEEDSRFGANTVTVRTGSYLIAGASGKSNTFYILRNGILEEITIE